MFCCGCDEGCAGGLGGGGGAGAIERLEGVACEEAVQVREGCEGEEDFVFEGAQVDSRLFTAGDRSRGEGWPPGEGRRRSEYHIDFGIWCKACIKG